MNNPTSSNKKIQSENPELTQKLLDQPRGSPVNSVEEDSKNKVLSSKTYKSIDELHSLKPIPYFTLFKYTTGGEKFLVFLAIIFSLGQGVSNAMMALILGNSSGDLAGGGGASKEDIINSIKHTSNMAYIFGGGMLFCTFVSISIWRHLGRVVEKRVRLEFFSAILKQDTAWYDIIGPEKVTAVYNEDTSNYIKAIGDQNHMALQVFGLMTGGIVVGYAKSAYFALVMTAMGPLIGFGAGLWFWA
jgi:ATP-binding cassette subfamily B (MDR/TAP) protein 1